jgi:hypothetical protein
LDLIFDHFLHQNKEAMVSHNFVVAFIEPLKLCAFLATSIMPFTITNTNSKKGEKIIVEEDHQLCKSYFHIL